MLGHGILHHWEIRWLLTFPRLKSAGNIRNTLSSVKNFPRFQSTKIFTVCRLIVHLHAIKSTEQFIDQHEPSRLMKIIISIKRTK
jgi:hypothetical protein